MTFTNHLNHLKVDRDKAPKLNEDIAPSPESFFGWEWCMRNYFICVIHNQPSLWNQGPAQAGFGFINKHVVQEQLNPVPA
jgi:hypothetical protein